MKKNRKVKVYKIDRYWYAHMPTGGEGFDIETMVVGMGDTPEQAYNEWERLVGRRDDRARTQEKWFNVFNLLFYVSGIIGMLLFGAFWLAAYLK